MADSSDWSDNDREKSSGQGSSSKKKGGPPTWLRVLSPISNVASLRKGGKVRSKNRMKARS
jgi:hypothetical protein